MIHRILENTIKDRLKYKKILVIYGPRQVGKTTLLENIFANQPNILWINGDNLDERLLISQESVTNLRPILKNKDMLIIDEAQRIENIGIILKIIYDQLHIPIVATGSSSFELANQINEALTGRKFEYLLLPFSFEELSNHYGFFEEYKNLTNRLIYGSYPDVIINEGNEREILSNLVSGYLYKDILEWNKIKKSSKLIRLLQALAFQIGNQISYLELSRLVGINKETVENYIDLLEKSFVIFSLPSYNKNLRTELKKSKKIFFYDVGIRNALIDNFKPIKLRNDVGALWENYILSERIKFINYHQIYANKYFWRTKSQQEIDYIEERDGKLYAFEFKWNTRKKYKFPKKFIEAYPENETKIITPENYYEFITDIKNE